jgi:hypothetical protein
MVSVLAIVPKDRGFKTGPGDGFLRAIKSEAHIPLEVGSKAGVCTSYNFKACKITL